jgi:uncharacterized membrane protein
MTSHKEQQSNRTSMDNWSRKRKYGFWLIPTIYIVSALAAGLVFPRFEARINGRFSPMSTSAAMAIYSSVGSGMMALTGIVFSLKFVMMQFSGSAYSPRLLSLISRDQVTAHALVLTFIS